MQKDDLKSIVTQMCENLIEQIDLEKSPTKEQILNYLKDSVDVLTSIDDSKIDSIEHAKSAFSNAYKEIAKKGISSYENTNERFEELTKLHVKTLNECKEPHIDLDSITNKFNDIQQHMSDEVIKANKLITQLTNQVKTLEKTSNLDSLTQIFNRRALSTYLETICSKENLKYELHLLMMDIDDFKAINDTHGHVAGDKILIFIANIIKKTLRDGDKIFRYGGEEFVIILNRIDKKSCMQIASRLLKLISGNNLIYEGNSLDVTISMGTTQLEDGDTPDSLISRADKALYKAKANGKNQVCSDVKDGI
ncbi:MAG: GGDEF domain-containing protein [Campylobacterota bacterium]|nr:GGDEF domain-containing protein [Campylobacterota bacterium]